MTENAILNQAEASYESPVVEVIGVEVESGFSVSGGTNDGSVSPARYYF